MLVSGMPKTDDSLHFDLDFAPRSPTPAIFPLFVWNNWALNHFSAPMTPSLIRQDVSAQPLESALQQIYPQLNFAELSRLYRRLKLAELSFSPETLFSFYNFRFDSRLEKILDVFEKLPLEFQNWCGDREVSPRDISPLTALPDPQVLNDFFTLVHESASFSRSQMAQALELLVELSLMKNSWSVLTPADVTKPNWPDFWLLTLKSLRFPVTTEKDQEQKDQWNTLPWSKDFSTKWTRSGDKSGLEVKFTLTSKSDLEKKLSALQRVHESWNE